MNEKLNFLILMDDYVEACIAASWEFDEDATEKLCDRANEKRRATLAALDEMFDNRKV